MNVCSVGARQVGVLRGPLQIIARAAPKQAQSTLAVIPINPQKNIKQEKLKHFQSVLECSSLVKICWFRKFISPTSKFLTKSEQV